MLIPHRPLAESDPAKTPEQQAADAQAEVLKQLMAILAKVNKQDVLQVRVTCVRACRAPCECTLISRTCCRCVSHAVTCAVTCERMSCAA